MRARPKSAYLGNETLRALARLHGLRRDRAAYLNYYNHDRVHSGRLTHGRIPADIVYGANKMKATR